MTARTHTPDRKTVNDQGRTVTTITQQRACNGCTQLLGDVTDDEMNRAIAGLPLTDVRSECEHCAPLVALEAAGCTTWHLTPRSYSRIAHEIDRLKPWVFTKGYWQTVNDELQIVGLRVGQYPNHVVARFGDWLVRHPDGGFTVHKAPAAAEASGSSR